MTMREKILVQATVMLFIMAPPGCVSNSRVLDLRDGAEHDQLVATADRPVIVEYYKDVCPPCGWQLAELVRIGEAYGSRVMLLKLKVFNALIVPLDAEFVAEHGLVWTPTTILYVNGEEAYRWTTAASADDMQPVIELILELKK